MLACLQNQSSEFLREGSPWGSCLLSCSAVVGDSPGPALFCPALDERTLRSTFPDCLSLQVILVCLSFGCVLFHTYLKSFKALKSFGSKLP